MPSFRLAAVNVGDIHDDWQVNTTSISFFLEEKNDIQSFKDIDAVNKPVEKEYQAKWESQHW